MHKDIESLDSATKALLSKYNFDDTLFAKNVKELEKHGYSPDRNRLKDPVLKLPQSDLNNLPSRGSDEYIHLEKIGKDAIKKGRVGCIVLNGGMATRFGGVTKGVVKACLGRSFLDLKLSRISNISDGKAPVFLMNSFSTGDETKDHLSKLNFSSEVSNFFQMISLRLTPGGKLFRLSNGKPSLCVTGHGDLPFAMAKSKRILEFAKGEGRYVMVSNVDNLGATLDPVIIGMHIAGRKPMTVEIVSAYKNDIGGFPASLDGKPVIVEAFAAPSSFDISSITSFNTNTFVFDIDALLDSSINSMDLTRYAVKKLVDGKEAVQFERLLGQLSWFMDVQMLKVPRDGILSRFVPIKTPGDLTDMQGELKKLLARES